MPCLTDVLGKYYEELQTVGGRIHERASCCKEQESRVAGYLLIIIRFALDTFLSIASELGEKRVFQAAILARSVYESAACVAWAFKTGKHDTLWADWLKDYVDWLKSAERLAPWKPDAMVELPNREAELRRFGIARGLPKPRGLFAALAKGELTGRSAGEFENLCYTIFGELSFFSHGNGLALASRVLPKSVVVQNTVFVCLMSSYWLTVCGRGFLAEDEEIPAIRSCEEQRLRSLVAELNSCDFSSFDQLPQGGH